MDTLTIEPESKLNLNLDPETYADFNEHGHGGFSRFHIHPGTIYAYTILGVQGHYDVSRAHDFRGSDHGLTRSVRDGSSFERGNQHHTVNPVNIFLIGCNLFVPSVIELNSTKHPIGDFHEWPDTVSEETTSDIDVRSYIRKYDLEYKKRKRDT
jgi:hypothetical protein